MTGTNTGPHPAPTDSSRIHAILGMVGDKWSLLVVCNLRHGPRRFTELKRAIDGVSQRMLTVTLRNLERQGILTRTIHQVMPPHVSYELTPMGATLCATALPMVEWAFENSARIDDARTKYDARALKTG
ncbi:winged helix-turn-helix transcriptional regulator [Winogradskya humida]|uniref:HxlR family transcriptional regulator n=1 Tax=Winogradskya humida TaxID=113566 RepID=A0ABQ4A4J3_9ACTN|nr:helix-turn-helix domain-containing protein [Actinoplanes humidus]GIE25775.1 HxlR family transcriptional regulator [Actinoplanes humidus]